jgi:hypothetical protein
VRPTLVIVAGRTIDSFRVMQYLGVVAGLALGAETVRRGGGSPDAFLLAGFLLFVPALIAAHAGPAAAAGAVSSDAWLMPRHRSGFFFALPAAAAAGPLALWSVGLHPGYFLDGAAVAVATGTIFGRLGCLLHGCCAGRPTSSRLGLELTDVHGVCTRRVPTQLLDATWSAALLAGLLATAGSAPPGVCFAVAATLYGAGRFLTDFTRQERPRAGALSAGQRGALALVIGGGCALVAIALASIP